MRVLEALSVLTDQGPKYELPSPPEEFLMAMSSLKRDSYQILVVGEVKRGKSSLLNALLGKELLPTDVGVATSQVFHISHAANDAYRVRFEDNSQLTITAAELPKYGSQVVADLNGPPRLDQIIKWIEVETPFCNLPKGVSIMDTPGVGGLNVSHAEITSRFIKHADAVIFVLDSERPIGHAEVTFLRSIVRRTRSVLFVQTKIDARKREEWELIRARNEEILQKNFLDQHLDCRVWPISSKLLLQSCDCTKNAEILRVHSRHTEFEQSFREFLYRVVGWSRAVDASILGKRYCDEGLRLLAARQSSIEDESKRSKQQFEMQLIERQNRFQTDGQEFAKTSGKMKERLDEVTRNAKRQLQNDLRSVECDLRNRIDRVDGIDEAKGVVQELADEAVRCASNAWQDIEDAGCNVYCELLSNFLTDLLRSDQNAVFERGVGMPGMNVSMPEFEGDFLSKVQFARNHSVNVQVVAGIPAGVLVAAGVLSLPVAAIGVVAVGIWGGTTRMEEWDQERNKYGKEPTS